MLTVIVQKLFAATVPPDKLMLLPPAVALTDPLQPFTTPGVLETTRPAGRLSVKATPVNASPFELLILNVTVVFPPTGIAVGLKVLRILGGATTVRLAVDELPVPPSVEVTGPAVFVRTPAAFPVTLTEILHDVFAAMDPPLRLMSLDPAVAVTVPLQVFVTPGVAATTKPVGRASKNATPVSGIPFEFEIWKLTVVVPPRGIIGEPKVLRIAGGAATVRLALDEFPVPPSFDVTGPAVFR